MALDKLREECGVFGVCVKVLEGAGITYNGLLALQHRGQEAAGIAVLSRSAIKCIKRNGLVNEVFSDQNLKSLPPSGLAIGHTRYSSESYGRSTNAQPFVTEYLKGRVATANNGNITNILEIREMLMSHGMDYMGASDSRVLSALVAFEALESGDAQAGVINAAKKLKGAFSLIVMSCDNKLIAVRDPYGYRPLCIGKNEWGYAVSSESCALDSADFSFVRDVAPGEMVVFQNGKIIHESKPLSAKKCGVCIFEFVYFARPDSVLDGLSVYDARYNMGAALAKEHPADADCVVGVPDSGIEAAFGFAAASNLPLVPGFVKNRYIGRSFIFPTQSQRESAVRIKLNPLSANVAGKSIVLVDDSIVRGTTSGKIIRSLRESGAKAVHLRISSPPFRYACYYGTDIASADDLIANRMSIEGIRQKLGADSLGYISVAGLVEACKKCRLSFCTGCFSGEYPG